MRVTLSQKQGITSQNAILACSFHCLEPPGRFSVQEHMVGPLPQTFEWRHVTPQGETRGVEVST